MGEKEQNPLSLETPKTPQGLDFGSRQCRPVRSAVETTGNGDGGPAYALGLQRKEVLPSLFTSYLLDAGVASARLLGGREVPA